MLVAWLNQAEGPLRDRVLSLQAELREIEALLPRVRSDHAWLQRGRGTTAKREETSFRYHDDVAELDRRLSAINEKLMAADKAFFLRVQYDLAADVWRPAMLADAKGEWTTTVEGQTISEADAVRALIGLHLVDKLRNLGQCTACQSWYFVTKSHKKFCSEECRVQSYPKAPGFNARKAEIQRLWRERERIKAEAALRKARRK